jgi:hypothetical protein
MNSVTMSLNCGFVEDPVQRSTVCEGLSISMVCHCVLCNFPQWQIAVVDPRALPALVIQYPSHININLCVSSCYTARFSGVGKRYAPTAIMK